jgi:hypothetical protein
MTGLSDFAFRPLLAVQRPSQTDPLQSFDSAQSRRSPARKLTFNVVGH